MENKEIQIFEDKKIRTVWNEETEEWYFSVVDVIGVLTTSCNQLKMKSPKDGKYYKTDVADTE